jgi:hypothetical protein
MASKLMEANMSSLKSLMMIVFENQPRKWPRAKTSKDYDSLGKPALFHLLSPLLGVFKSL